MDITWGVFSGDGEERNRGEKVQGRSSIIGRHKIDGKRSKIVKETKNSKKLLCTTHGHELRGKGMLKRWGVQG